MINAYSSAQLAYSAPSTHPALAAGASMANGAAGLYARQNLPAAAARNAASLAAGKGGNAGDRGSDSGADKVSISPEALALRQAERDGAAALPSAPSRFAANGVPVDFAPWQAAVRETEQRIEERVALYKKGKETDATDEAILRRIAAYDEMLAGTYIPGAEAPPAPGASVAERPGGQQTPHDARRHPARDALN